MKTLTWNCPNCGTENVDVIGETSFPMCEGCIAGVEWGEIFDNIPFPECSHFCPTIVAFGAGDCKTLCGQKFREKMIKFWDDGKNGNWAVMDKGAS